MVFVANTSIALSLQMVWFGSFFFCEYDLTKNNLALPIPLYANILYKVSRVDSLIWNAENFICMCKCVFFVPLEYEMKGANEQNNNTFTSDWRRSTAKENHKKPNLWRQKKWNAEKLNTFCLNACSMFFSALWPNCFCFAFKQ